MRFFRKYGVGLDVYERHAIVSRLLTESGSKSVLDVGGTAGTLQMFSSNFDVTTINIDDSGDSLSMLACLQRYFPLS